MASKWRASGQACITANRIYVQRGISANFISEYSKAMGQSLKIGAGFDEGTTLGPLTTPQSVSRAEKHVQDAVARGAKLVTGGKKPDGEAFLGGFYFEPTLLVGAPQDSLISKEETFSPIASVYIFDTEEEVSNFVMFRGSH